MIRMLLAAGAVYILLPQNLEPKIVAGEAKPVSTIETLTAADAIIRDIGNICERNAEACETVKALMRSAKQTIQAGLGRITENQSEAAPQPAEPVSAEASE